MPSTKLYRVQCSEGRGPFRPGITDQWLDDSRTFWPMPHIAYPGVLEIIDTAHAKRLHMGTGCRALDQIRLWFNADEQRKLRGLGYEMVAIEADEVLWENEEQVLFACKRPLRECLLPM